MLADRIRMCSFKSKGTLIDRTTPAVVVNQPYSTEGNGGRKSVRLSNGWLVAVTYSAKKYYFHVSKNFGETWNQLCFIDSGASYMKDACNISIVSTGTRVYALYHNTGNSEYTYVATFDATTVGNVNVKSSSSIDTQTLIGNVSSAINKEGTELHACWSSKNSPYLNSFNIRYCKGTISANGTVTWGSVEQITMYNHLNYQFNNPTIIYRDRPLIIVDAIYNIYSRIMIFGDNQPISASNSKWRYGNILDGGTYIQSSPSAYADKDKVIHATWHGTDVGNSTSKIKYSKSIDGGVTWTAPITLWDGNSASCTFPSITGNSKNEIFISYMFSTGNYIHKSTDNGNSFEYLRGYATNKNPSTLLDNNLDFEIPLTISMKSQAVEFYGKWYE